MTPISIEETAAYLKQCRDVHILIHRSPDGDCIGSGYSLQAVLKKYGIRSRVLCADPIPVRFGYLLPDEEEEAFEPQCVISVDLADEHVILCHAQALEREQDGSQHGQTFRHGAYDNGNRHRHGIQDQADPLINA